jgi:pimeloyl-ACP methyl ester carboxylesterase
LLVDPVFAGTGVPDGTGRPVMVIPGFLAPDLVMQTMVGWLRRTGHHASYARIGVNARFSEATIGRLERRLASLVDETGRRAVIVGHSRGGHFARVLAIRRAELVAGVLTLGTPPLDLSTGHAVIRLSAGALSVIARAGVPGVFGARCFSGPCCAQFRADLAAPMPRALPFCALVGRRDGLVDRDACAVPGADVVWVGASHVGLVANADAYRAIAALLGRVGSLSEPAARG